MAQTKKSPTATPQPNDSTATPKVRAKAQADEGMASANLSTKDYKLLWGRAAARCAFPGCRQKLTEAKGTATYGERVSHRCRERGGASRGQPPFKG